MPQYPIDEGNLFGTEDLDRPDVPDDEELIIRDLTWPVVPPRASDPWEISSPIFGETPTLIDPSNPQPQQWVAPPVGKVLFEDQDWFISENNGEMWDCNINTDTVMWHYCTENHWRSYADLKGVIEAGICNGCNEDVPASVQTIWKLQNMEHLPIQDDWDPWDDDSKVVGTSGPIPAYFDEWAWELLNNGELDWDPT
jgi:hypothetical protein